MSNYTDEVRLYREGKLAGEPAFDMKEQDRKELDVQYDINEELERICNEVMAEYGMSFGGVYLDFAKEVARRAMSSLNDGLCAHP